ncbi:MAG: RIP metalloprotease RseP [Clostridiales bacterium]|jgi:regulator of sigma E protease|nr:RIP metalloprotease RseP [Clostridiales bacterium]
MITAISAVVIFLLLILTHELGHFIAAKSVGVRVLEFAVGMGPAIFKRRRGETLYSIRVLPIGGYCQLEGEDEESDDEQAFGNKARWQRFVVLAAGAFMNILTGFVIFLIIMFLSAQVETPIVNEVIDGSPAQAAGLIAGDRITRVNGVKINIQQDFDFEMSRYQGGDIAIDYTRDRKEYAAVLTPMPSEDGRFILGFKKTVLDLTFGERLRSAYYSTLYFSKVVIVSLGDLITGRYGFREVSGPVGIVQYIGEAAKTGVMDLLYLTALIAINLGVFNLLPLPALDGGRLLFLLVEAARRKKIPPDKEGMVHFVGFALLILLMLAATTNDIGKLVAGLAGQG